MRIPFCSFRIFICHASEDREVALELSTHLRGEGHEVFLDEESLPPGATYVGRIRKALRRSQLFLFLVSPDSVEPKRYTLSELEEAVQKWQRPKGRIMPVQVRDTPPATFPHQLKPLHVLVPKGSLSAEVTKAVSVRANRRCAAIYGIALVALLLLALGAAFLLRILNSPQPSPSSQPPTPPQPSVLGCEQLLTQDAPEIDDPKVVLESPTPPTEGHEQIPRAMWAPIAGLIAVSWGDETVVRLGSEFSTTHSYEEGGFVEIKVYSADVDGNCMVQRRIAVLPRQEPVLLLPDKPPGPLPKPPPGPCPPCPQPLERPEPVDSMGPLPLPQPTCVCLVIDQRQTAEIDELGEGLRLEVGDVDRKTIEFVRLRYQVTDPPGTEREEGVDQRDDVQSGASLVFELPGPTPQQLEVKILAVEAGFFGGKGKATVNVCPKN